MINNNGNLENELPNLSPTRELPLVGGSREEFEKELERSFAELPPLGAAPSSPIPSRAISKNYKYEDLLKLRNHAQEFSEKSWLKFDDFIIKLSSGAFGLSITVVANMFKNQVKPYSVIPFFLGCGFLLLAISFTLYSYVESYFEYRQFMDEIDLKIFPLKKEELKKRIDGGQSITLSTKKPKTLMMNKRSFWFLIFGLFFVVIFIVLNLLFK